MRPSTGTEQADKTISSATTAQYQHVQLTGLEPNTSYIYRARPSDNKDVFSNRTFRTMPVSDPFTFIVISDSHAQEKRFKYVADAIAKYETDVLFILDGGDYAGWDYEAYWTIYFQYADGMLAKFPIFHTIGNHEYHNLGHADGPPTNADQYHWTFDVPAKGALNYSFDCSNIRFIVLNSPDPNNANGDDPHTSLVLAQSQVPWLEGLLKDNMAGVFTIHHHPIWDYFNSTNNPDLQPWEDLYHAYNISANFAGHTHSYQRYSVEGIPYFIVGNAGGKFADLTDIPPVSPPVWYQFGATRQLGYLKVTVDPANNTATAQEIFVAWVETDDSEKATVYNPPIIAETITFPLRPTVTSMSSGGCFIATAAFGSYFDPYVKILRDFRDTFLVTNYVGQSFVNWYYRVSPPIANFIRTREIMKTVVRIILLPAVGFAYLCLKVGVFPTLIVLLFSAAVIYLGIRRFYRFRYISIELISRVLSQRRFDYPGCSARAEQDFSPENYSRR
ncbi:MAG: hypothetical protein NTX36_11745 [Proteobacteria bacterium]|nr:hypothetical protein [Pseudomonadota bacterium]